MRKILLWESAFLLMSATCKKSVNVSMIFIKDCTGSYLRYNGKDYHICNIEKVKGLSNADTVLANFTKLKECNGIAKEGIICMMYHANEGWIEIKSISKKQ